MTSGRASSASPRGSSWARGLPSGAILPFSFDERLELFIDLGLLADPEFFFNAAWLDRSIALSAEDCKSIAEPRVEAVSLG